MAEDNVTNPQVHFRAVLPPDFTGDGNESFSQWARHFQVCCETSGMDKPQLAKVLPSRLAGAAFSYWDSLSDDIKVDYNTTWSKLAAVFDQKQLLRTFQTYLNARPRLSNEPLEVYAAELTRQVHQDFPDYGESAIKGEILRRFIAGLEPALQAKLYEFGVTTFEDAIKVAGRCERARSAATESFSLPAPAAPQPAVVHSLTTESTNMLAAQLSDLHLKVDKLQSVVTMLTQPKSHYTSSVSSPKHHFAYRRRSPSLDRASRYQHFTASDEPYFRRRSPVRSSDSHRRPQGSPRSSYHQQQGYERPLLYDSRHIRFSPQRGYAAYDVSVTSQPSYRRQSNDDSSSDMNRDRRRGEQYYRHRSPSPQRPHSRHVHFNEQQRSGNEW